MRVAGARVVSSRVERRVRRAHIQWHMYPQESAESFALTLMIHVQAHVTPLSPQVVMGLQGTAVFCVRESYPNRNILYGEELGAAGDSSTLTCAVCSRLEMNASKWQRMWDPACR